MAIISRLPQGGEIDNKVPITLTLEGAKEDTITITDSNGEQVGECVFAIGCTSGTVDLMIFDGDEYTFTSSVAKDTETGTIDYKKTVVLKADDSEYQDIMIPLVPAMTSNTEPSGVVFGDVFYSDAYYPYMAFDKSPSTKFATYTANAIGYKSIGYTFNEPKNVTVFSYSGNIDSPYLPPETIQLQGSNNGSDWVNIGNIVSPTQDANTHFVNVENANSYTSYRLYCKERTYNAKEHYCQFSEIQFYSKDIKGIKVMPEGALYWYGNECFEKTGGWGKYNYVAKWIGSKTYDGLKYTNHMEVNDTTTTTNSDGAVYVGTSKKIDLTNYSECSFIGFIGRSPYTKASNGICLVAEQSFGTSTGGMGDGIELDYSTSGSYKDCLTTPAHYSIESAYKREMYMTFYNGRDGVRGTKIVAIYLS